MNIPTRLQILRDQMKKNNIHAYIIPSTDPHQSEYVAPHWKSREWISGFTGSAGTVVVFLDQAGLWTDSRYYLQAEAELEGSTVNLFKMANQFEPLYVDHVITTLQPGQNVAIDGYMWSRASSVTIEKKCKNAGLGFLKNLDLISPIWENRPPLSSDIIFEHDIKYCGVNTIAKINGLRQKMKSLNLDYHLVTALDDIAWTFNIRGNDVEYNPVTIAYAIIGLQETFLFIDPVKVDLVLSKKFASEGVQLLPYSDLEKFIQTLPKESRMLVDPGLCSATLFDMIPCKIEEGNSLPKWAKAIKNNVEINHIRHAMAKDGAALADTFCWLEHALGKESITEYNVLEKLKYFRSHQAAYFGESFDAIVGYQGNGAIIHYAPPASGSANILPQGILLVDSGGQYHDGTTDITRTFALDEPSAEAKKHYTLILKGLIALSRAVFPKGTTGGQLDTLARQFLWENGLNYLHGTGHGVGFFLNVHEPPQGFAAVSSERSRTVIEAGMLTSNEPGHYVQGLYGMRLENLIISKESDIEGFLEFETVTLYPFELGLINQKLLTPAEIRWFNQYHQHVYAKVSPLLEENTRIWFEKKCAVLPWHE